MTTRQEAARLLALLEDPAEIETRPIAEIGQVLELLGADPAAAVGRARRRIAGGGSAAGALLARIAEGEETDRQIAELGAARLEDVRARLQEAAGLTAVPQAVNGLAHAGGMPADTPISDIRMQRRRAWFSPAVIVGLLRLADATIVLLAAIAAYLTRFHDLADFGTLELYGGVFAMLLTINILQLAGLYRFDQLTNLLGQSGRLLLAWALVMLSLLALGFMARAPLVETSRLWVGLWFVYGLFGLFSVRLLLKHQIQRWQEKGRLTRNIVVVGAGGEGQRLLEYLLARTDGATRVIGVFDDQREVPDQVCGVPVLGGIADLMALARRQPVDQVIVALPLEAEARLRAWMQQLRGLSVDVSLCPHVGGAFSPFSRMTRVAGLPMLSLLEKPLTGWSYIAKSLEDRGLAGAILVVIAPLMLLIAALIKLDSPGPVVFRQKRYGVSNELIEVFKFRTMYVEHCSDERVLQVTRNDPRVTRFGRILRRTSLDELPQFLNVLMGTMSIVGPRPHAVAHDLHYARLIETYAGRRRVKPGITGWAQVNGLRGEIHTLEGMEQRVRYDLYYIENWSLLFDIRIILRTLFVGFSHPNAY
jgi:Undecaprenyl-phosphate glucose phosphotransferase